MKALKVVMAAMIALSVNFAQANEELPPLRDVYVGVNDVFVPSGFDSDTDAYVIASGIFPNGCYSWKGVEVHHRTESLHEIATVASVSQGMCLMVLVPFTKEVKLGRLAAGKHTLRFLNGDGTYLEKALVVE